MDQPKKNTSLPENLKLQLARFAELQKQLEEKRKKLQSVGEKEIVPEKDDKQQS